jgi:hypothetical protein
MTTDQYFGTWKVKDFAGEQLVILSEGKKLVATCTNKDGDTMSANARLIAAAPELLKALQELVAEADQGGSSVRSVSRYNVDKARAAIAKATNN